MTTEFNGLSLESIADLIEGGLSISQVAATVGKPRSSLWNWIEADPVRSVRAREARSVSAERWDDLSVAVIEDAGDPFALAKAKELAHHYRWRASKIAPAIYGDKVEQKHTGSIGLTMQATPEDEAL